VTFVFEATRSPNIALTLRDVWIGIPAISLKILLLHSSHSFQQTTFGTHIQQCFRRLKLEKEKGAKSTQEVNKEVTEVGRGTFNWPRMIFQISRAKGQRRKRWTEVSA
jgi:hypothetical protein